MSEYRTWGPKPHPDYFWLTSGGVDSVAAYLLTKDALHDNFQKRPVVTYLDTRIGNPLQRLYVEKLCDTYREQMWSLRTHEHFEDRVAGEGKFTDRDDNGPPGPQQHSPVQNELKGRQREKLAAGYDDVIYVTGIRAGESPKRAEKPKGEQGREARYIKPVYSLTKKECARIILEHEDCPINPLWTMPGVVGDCGCLSNGDPSELDKTEERFPEFAQRLREIEEAADASGYKSLLGWGGMTAEEQSLHETGHKQVSLCGGGCGRERDPAIVRAFRARLDGKWRTDDALDILDTPRRGVA